MPAALAVTVLLALAGYITAKTERGRPRTLGRHAETQHDDHEGEPTMNDFDYECFGQSIDGIWHGCGCPDCDEAEDDAIEADAETGTISDAEARALHAANDYARGYATEGN